MFASDKVNEAVFFNKKKIIPCINIYVLYNMYMCMFVYEREVNQLDTHTHKSAIYWPVGVHLL